MEQNKTEVKIRDHVETGVKKIEMSICYVFCFWILSKN
jgi:hypothetical protein